MKAIVRVKPLWGVFLTDPSPFGERLVLTWDTQGEAQRSAQSFIDKDLAVAPTLDSVDLNKGMPADISVIPPPRPGQGAKL